MNKSSFLRQDWFASLLFSLVFLLCANCDFVKRLELKAYDWVMLSSSRIPSDKIAVIAIDEKSIASLGALPWSREIHAQMLDVLATSQAKVIAHTAFFFEPQADSGLDYIHKIADLLGKSQVLATAVSANAASSIVAASAVESSIPLSESTALDALLLEADRNLDHDKRLGKSIANANNVLLGMFFKLGVMQGNGEPNLLDYVSRNNLTNVAASSDSLFAQAVSIPIPLLGSKASAIGHLNSLPDVDGVLRAEPLVIGYSNQFYPSLSLILAAKSLNLEPKDIQVDVDGFVHLGKQKIATDRARQMNTYFYKNIEGKSAFSVDSFADVLAGKIPVEKYRDKIVLIGVTAPEMGALQVTPISTGMPPVLTLAHSVSSILKGDFFIVPSWAKMAESAVFASVVLYLIFLLPRLKATIATILTGTIFVTLLSTYFILMTTQAIWLQLMLPALLLLLGYVILMTKRFLVHATVQPTSVPELVSKLPAVQDLSATVILDSAKNQKTNTSTLVLNKSDIPKLTLGNYEIENQLGKGAMGVVYHGRDLKIGREVAIKTMALAQDFDADELQEVKERFFREAETAGRLHHPNIVSIYDAGEEGELVYIAMELLRGKDLVSYTKPDNLLPLPVVISIAARVADALDYAHKQNVVHRDIKPANIMYDADTDTPKVTDFGIARITDSNKTKTGMVLGTPSYMSPEQLAGKKIQGASDLFSLGVSLYQLACGKLPFEGDSMAQLMYRISNEAHRDILLVNADLPPCLVEIINKSLAKQSEDRYANGAEMAEALRRCAATQG